MARAIYTEIVQGRGTANGAVYLDVTHRGGDYIRKKLPSMYSQFLEFAGVDITKEKMEVAPTLHYQMGGVRVEPETGATRVVGLYAAGEVACGLHGANRLGGNSLGDILVFGRRAGLAAAEYSKKAEQGAVVESDVQTEISRILSPFAVRAGKNPFALKEKIAAVMWKYVGIVRSQAQLEQGLSEILAIAAEAKSVQAVGPRPYNQSWFGSLQVWNMVLDCEAIIRSAMERRESRGAHTRSDFPGKDDGKWLVNIVTREDGGRMVRELVPVQSPPAELEELIEEE